MRVWSLNIKRLTLGSLILFCALFGGTSGCAGPSRAEPGISTSMRLARQQMARNQFETARRVLLDARQQAESDEDMANLAIALGDCCYEMRDYAGASDQYFRARSLMEAQESPLTYEATMGLARSRLAEGQWASAERHYLEAITLSSRNEQRDRAFLALARAAIQENDRIKARSYLDRIEDQGLLGVNELNEKLAAVPHKAEPEQLQLPTVLAPEVLERARWGSQGVRSSGNPEPMEKPWRITVHHSAEPDLPPTDLAQAAAQMRSFQAFHQNDKGWADIGYHYVIDGAGRIWEGRPINVQGAHAGTRELNRGNIGVCLMGNFVSRDPTADQKKSLRRLLSWLCESHHIHPRFVVGHRAGLQSDPDKSTLCPGARLESYLIRLKAFLPRP